MKQEIDLKLIKALENLIIIADEQFASRRVVDADDVIALQSAGLVKQLVRDWYDHLYARDPDELNAEVAER